MKRKNRLESLNMCLCGGRKKTQVRLKENASTFRFKRTCVLDKMYLRFDSNAEAFYWKRTCVSGALENRLETGGKILEKTMFRFLFP